MNLSTWLFGDDRQIPHWTLKRAQAEERKHYERLGLSGFHFAWAAKVKAHKQATSRRLTFRKAVNQ